MAATVTHRDGRMSAYADDDALDLLLAELDGSEDAEHPDVSIAHESGWALSAFPSGLVVWENVREEGSIGHRASVGRGEVQRLFRLVAHNELEVVAAYGWQPGYGS